jgi:hypothetical protein
MLVSSEPAALVNVALALIEAFEEEELPRLRAGAPHGPASIRAGDFYGNPVNMASRLTGSPTPGRCYGRRRYAMPPMPVSTGPPQAGTSSKASPARVFPTVPDPPRTTPGSGVHGGLRAVDLDVVLGVRFPRWGSHLVDRPDARFSAAARMPDQRSRPCSLIGC